MRRLCTRIHVQDGREGIIKYDMVLRGYSTSARVKNQSKTSGMKWGVTKVHSNTAPWLPFRRTRASSALRTRIKNIHWTEECVVCLDGNRVQGDSMQYCIRSKTLTIQ